MSGTAPGLKKTLGTFQLWGIAVGLVISGEYFGWSYGWASAGTLGFAVTVVFVALMYTCFIYSSQYWFGLALDPLTGRHVSTRGSTYLEANWSQEVAPGLTLTLHVGRQHLRRLGMFDFTDVKIGVTKQWKTWSLGLAAMHNDGARGRQQVPLWTFPDANGRGRRVSGSAVVHSATQAF